MKKTGKIIRKGKKFNLTECLPDDPVYSRGFVFGIKTVNNISKNTRTKPSDNATSKK